MALPTRGQPDWDDDLGNHLAGIEADTQSAKANADAAISAANEARNVAQSVQTAVLGGSDTANAELINDSSSATAQALSAAYEAALRPSYAVGRTGRFDPSSSTYNLTPSSVHAVRSKVASAISSRVRIAAMGHSMLAGSNAAPGQTDSPRQLRDFLSTFGVPIGGTGIVYVSSKETLDSRWTLGAGWTRNTASDVAYADAGVDTATATFVSDRAGTAVDIAYLGTSRAFTYTIDGGAPVTVTPTGADATEVTSVTGLANTTHTVVIKPTAPPTTEATLLRGGGALTAGAAKFGAAGRATGAYGVPGALTGIFTAGTPGTLGTGTIECWFRLPSTPGSTKVIFGQDTGFWVGLTSAGFVTAQIGAGAPGTNVTLTGSTNFANNQWHHLALDLDAGKPSIYVDGNRILTSATTAVPSGSPTYSGLVIGGFGGAGLTSFDWTGDIDEVRVSTTRRYTGTTYTVPTGEFTPDGSTTTVVHFNTAVAGTLLIGAGVRGTTGVEITNAGRGGTRAFEWLPTGTAKLYSEAIGSSDPHIAIVQLDTNEIVGGHTVADYKTRMAAIITALQARGTAVVLVASPSYNPGGSGYPTKTQAEWEAFVAAEYELADQFDVPLLDLTHMFVSNAVATADGLMGDQIHPGPAGYRRVAQALARILTH